MKISFILLVAVIFASCTSTSDEDLIIHAEAGDFDRYNSIISFQLPETLAHKEYHLTDSDGNSYPFQIDGQQGTFILTSLSRKESISFRLLPSGTEERNDAVIVQHTDEAVVFESETGNPVLHYRTSAEGLNLGDLDERFRRGGYLHPVYTPSGQVVTGHYNPDRAHQLGIWSGWSRIEFEGRNPDFWYPVTDRGEIKFGLLDKLWSGPVHSGIHTKHQFIDHTADEPLPILTETWAVQVYNTPEIDDQPVHMFDLDVDQQNISESPITFNEHVYGGISFRGNDDWLGEEGTRLLTSEGKTKVDWAPIRDVWSHVNAHQSRAKWAYLSGVVEGEHPGIIILVHPDNLNFPEPIFMNLREPFFAFSPTMMGDITVEPGESLRFRYRYVVLDEEPDPEFIENLWQDYANPVTITLN